MEIIGTLGPRGTIATLTHAWTPNDLAEYSTDSQVTIPPHWRKEANKFAKTVGGLVLGNAHSHPYTITDCLNSPAYRLDPSPSSADIELNSDEIMGIIVVCQEKNGGYSTNLKWYGPSVKLNVCNNR